MGRRRTPSPHGALCATAVALVTWTDPLLAHRSKGKVMVLDYTQSSLESRSLLLAILNVNTY